MTALVGMLGGALLVAFCVVWWPASLLVAGVLLLMVAWARSENERARARAR